MRFFTLGLVAAEIEALGEAVAGVLAWVRRFLRTQSIAVERPLPYALFGLPAFLLEPSARLSRVCFPGSAETC